MIQGGGGAGIRPTTKDQPRTVMRNPMRDPMRDIDLMVLGDVGASTPLPSSTREHRIQFASRTREPASRLLPLMARTPSFEAPFHFFKHFCTLCATLCAGPLISQDLDRRAGSKRAHKGVPCAQPYAPGTDFQGFRSWSGFQTSSKKGGVRSPMRGTPFSQDLDRGDGFEKDTSRK